MSQKALEIQRLQKLCPNLEREVIEDIYDQVGRDYVDEYLRELCTFGTNEASTSSPQNTSNSKELKSHRLIGNLLCDEDVFLETKEEEMEKKWKKINFHEEEPLMYKNEGMSFGINSTMTLNQSTYNWLENNEESIRRLPSNQNENNTFPKSTEQNKTKKKKKRRSRANKKPKEEDLVMINPPLNPSDSDTMTSEKFTMIKDETEDKAILESVFLKNVMEVGKNPSQEIQDLDNNVISKLSEGNFKEYIDTLDDKFIDYSISDENQLKETSKISEKDDGSIIIMEKDKTRNLVMVKEKKENVDDTDAQCFLDDLISNALENRKIKEEEEEFKSEIFDILGINEDIEAESKKCKINNDYLSNVLNGSKIIDDSTLSQSKPSTMENNKFKDENEFVLKKAMTMNQLMKSSYRPYAIIYKDFFEKQEIKTIEEFKNFCCPNDEKLNLFLIDHENLGDFNSTQMMTEDMRQLLDINSEKDDDSFNSKLKEFKLSLKNLSLEKSALSINKKPKHGKRQDPENIMQLYYMNINADNNGTFKKPEEEIKFNDDNLMKSNDIKDQILITIDVSENAYKLMEMRKTRVGEILNKIGDFETNNKYKAKRKEIEKQLKTDIVQISCCSLKVKDKVETMLALFKSLEKDERMICYAYKQLAKYLVSKCDGISEAIVFPLSNVVRNLIKKYPKILDILLYNLNEVSALTIPMFYNLDSKSINNGILHEYLGYREVEEGSTNSVRYETEDEFIIRQSGYIMFIAGLIQVYPNENYGINDGWHYLSWLLNVLPANRYTASALDSFLKIAGHAMYSGYKRQFVKLLENVEKNYLENLTKVGDVNCVAAVKSRLSTYISRKTYLEAPSGSILAEKSDSLNSHLKI